MGKKYCVVCGKELQGQQNKFCSNKCKQQYHYTKNSTNTSYRQFIRCNKRKLELIELRGGKCEKCGYNANLSALEFHHIDSTTKCFTLDARNIANRKEEDILNELQKCILVCSNCHREIHNPDKEISLIKELVEKDKSILHEKKEVIRCKECGKILTKETKTGLCEKCYLKHNKKANFPSREKLIQILQKHQNFEGASKELGYSNNGLRKVCKYYEIPTHTKEMIMYIKKLE